MADLDSHPFSIPELETEFLFRRRPVAVPGDLRPGWRIGLLALLLKRCCRQGRTSLTRLHVLNWAIRTDVNQQALLELIAGNLRPDALVVRFDPALNRAVDFAIGEGVIRRVEGGRIELTLTGTALADEVGKDQSLYPLEKKFIDDVRLRLTENIVDGLFGPR